TLHVHFFFFSSRRRHTRSKRDWSSDVCSSDLNIRVLLKEDLKLAADDTVYRGPRLAVSKFLLRLSFKLRILNLHTDDRREPFPRSEERRVGKECRSRRRAGA